MTDIYSDIHTHSDYINIYTYIYSDIHMHDEHIYVNIYIYNVNKYM